MTIVNLFTKGKNKVVEKKIVLGVDTKVVRLLLVMFLAGREQILSW